MLPSRSLPSGMMGGQGAAPYLNSRVVPQLVPIGWKSFEALAGAEAAQVYTRLSMARVNCPQHSL